MSKPRDDNFVLRLALRISRINKRIDAGLVRIWKNLSGPGWGYLYYRHPIPVRIMHWGNVLFLAILLMSGLNIFNAHPALYWGKSSYRGVPPVLEISGREMMKEKSPGSPSSWVMILIPPASWAPPRGRRENS